MKLLIAFCEEYNRTKTCLFGHGVGIDGTQDWFNFRYKPKGTIKRKRKTLWRFENI
jgi:hypothetical protein